MNLDDRPQFDEQLRLLCAGFNVPVGDRAEAYWKGVARMSLIEFARCVEFALGEHGPDKIPTSPQMWGIRKQLRTHREVPLESPPAPDIYYSPSQRFANQLLWDWLCWYCRGAGTWIPEELARTLYCEARELADHIQMLRDENDPAITARQFLTEFCDRVLTHVSPEIARRYGASVLARQRVLTVA